MILNIIYWATQRKWLLVSLSLSTVLYLLPTPQGLTAEGYHTIIIVLSTILLIIFEPIPLPAVAMLIPGAIRHRYAKPGCIFFYE